MKLPVAVSEAVQVTQMNSKHRAAPRTHFVLAAEQQRGFSALVCVFFTTDI